MSTTQRVKVASAKIPGIKNFMVEYAVVTDVGFVRENNEDNFLLCPDVGVFAVADGMGGVAGGEVASWVTSHTLRRVMSTLVDPRLPDHFAATVDDTVIDHPGTTLPDDTLLRFTVWHTHANLRERMRKHPELDRMGSTLVALYMCMDRLYIVNVGDSRAYRKPNDGPTQQITTDHTASQSITRDGRTRVRQVLTRVVGGNRDTTEADLFSFEPLIGNRILLCTDGVWGKLTAEAIDAHLSVPHLQTACQQLVDAALTAGSRDNLTALIIEIVPRPFEPEDCPPINDPTEYI